MIATALAVTTAAGCAAQREAQWDVEPAKQTQQTEQPAQQTPAEGGEASSLAQQAEDAWSNRGDQASLEKAIATLEKLAEQNPTDASIHARLSRAYFFLADAHMRKQGAGSDAYLSTFEKGTAAGERALGVRNEEFRKQVTSGTPVEKAASTLQKEDVEAAYWYASNLGKWARAKGFATTLGNKDKIKSVMDRVLALDPEFFHAAPHRYFGAFYAVAPAFAGGDLNKSKEHFEKSLAIAPGYAGTKVLMAETYAVKKQDRELFDKLLDEVLATPDEVIPGLEPETRNEKAKAQELKAQAAELF